MGNAQGISTWGAIGISLGVVAVVGVGGYFLLPRLGRLTGKGDEAPPLGPGQSPAQAPSSPAPPPTSTAPAGAHDAIALVGSFIGGHPGTMRRSRKLGYPPGSELVTLFSGGRLAQRWHVGADGVTLTAQGPIEAATPALAQEAARHLAQAHPLRAEAHHAAPHHAAPHHGAPAHGEAPSAADAPHGPPAGPSGAPLEAVEGAVHTAAGALAGTPLEGAAHAAAGAAQALGGDAAGGVLAGAEKSAVNALSSVFKG